MRGRSTRGMCSAVLSFEAVMMLLGILVLNGFSSVSVPAAAAIGCGMAVVCLVAIGMLGRPGGYALGHAVQVAIIALGLLALPILFMGVLFGGLWIAAYLIGMKIDGARAIR
jgi:hypothetical protein